MQKKLKVKSFEKICYSIKKRLGLICFSLFILVFGIGSLFIGEVEAEDVPYIDITEDTVWHKGDNLTFNKMVFVSPGATLTIEKGAEIKFGKDQSGSETGLSIYGGRVIASGTETEPIKISAEDDNNYPLVEVSYTSWEGIPEAEPSFFRYVEISNGGYVRDIGGEAMLNFISTAYAYEDGLPAVHFLGGKLHMALLPNSNFLKS